MERIKKKQMEQKEGGKYNIKKKPRKIGIKLKLLGVLLPVVICIIGIAIFFIYKNTSDILLRKSETLLRTSTESVVNQVTTWMSETITALDVERDTIEYFSMNETDELNYIKHTADTYESFPAGIYLATTDGSLIHASFVPGPEYNIFEKPWYQDGIKSEEFIFGSVYFDEDSQSYVVGASGVLKDKNGAVRGVAAADIYLDAISEIVKEVQLEQTGGMFLIDRNTDMIIGHKEAALVGTSLNEQSNGLYSYIGSLLSKETFGLQTYTMPGGETYYLDLEKVPDSNWITAAYVPHTEIMTDLNNLTKNIIFITLIGILLLSVIMERVISFIVKPVKNLNTAITSITNGDFQTEISIKTKDEIGIMAQGIKNYVQVMKNIIGDINSITSELAKQSVVSSEVADNLSGSSKLQSASMNEMNNTVNELTLSVTEVAENATSLSSFIEETREKGVAAGEQMKEAVSVTNLGKDNMRNLLTTMNDISSKMEILEKSAAEMEDSVVQINSIVDLIRDIAEETNLLSLNASIEAARAGEAGRGFAVVAGQIGKLAGNSKQSVEDIYNLTQGIRSLVENTVKETRDSAAAIKSSSDIVNKTERTFNTIYNSVSNTDKSVTEIIDKIMQVNDIATNVAGITEEQSASSEEILATTEDMRQNAENVYKDSQTVASNSETLKESASALETHLKFFKL